MRVTYKVETESDLFSLLGQVGYPRFFEFTLKYGPKRLSAGLKPLKPSVYAGITNICATSKAVRLTEFRPSVVLTNTRSVA